MESAYRLDRSVARARAVDVPAEDAPRPQCFPARGPITIDGDLGDWDRRAPLRIEGAQHLVQEIASNAVPSTCRQEVSTYRFGAMTERLAR